jgi:hypothetical protein
MDAEAPPVTAVTPMTIVSPNERTLAKIISLFGAEHVCRFGAISLWSAYPLNVLQNSALCRA